MANDKSKASQKPPADTTATPSQVEPTTPPSAPAEETPVETPSQTPPDAGDQETPSTPPAVPTASSDKPEEKTATVDLRKKAAFGAVLTILVAVVFASGFLYYNFINKPTEPAPTTTIDSNQLPKATLIVESPNDDQAFTISQVEVKGKTVPNSLISVYTDSYEDVFESDAVGNFSGVIALDEGPNEITFVAFGDDVEEKEETRSVVYVREEEL